MFISCVRASWHGYILRSWHGVLNIFYQLLNPFSFTYIGCEWSGGSRVVFGRSGRNASCVTIHACLLIKWLLKKLNKKLIFWRATVKVGRICEGNFWSTLYSRYTTFVVYLLRLSIFSHNYLLYSIHTYIIFIIAY